MAISGFENVAVYLVSGSEVSLSGATIWSSFVGLVALDVVGSFSVLFNSTFYGSQVDSSNVIVNYSLCVGPSYFNFSHNKLRTEVGSYCIELLIQVFCSNVKLLITLFESYNRNSMSSDSSEVSIWFFMLTNNSLLVNSSIFRGSI